MRAKEFIFEQHASMQDDVAAAIPATFVIPALANQDPYKQYRFGMALANARSRKAKEDEGQSADFQAQSPWGENAVIVSYSGTTKDIIDDALEQVGLSSKDKKQITSQGSNETKDVSVVSPVAKPKRNKYGV